MESHRVINTRELLAYVMVNQLNKESERYEKLLRLQTKLSTEGRLLGDKITRAIEKTGQEINHLSRRVPLDIKSYKHHVKQVYGGLMGEKNEKDRKYEIVVPFVIFMVELAKVVEENGDDNDLVPLHEFTARLIDDDGKFSWEEFLNYKLEKQYVSWMGWIKNIISKIW